MIALRLGPPPAGYANWTLRLLARKVVAVDGKSLRRSREYGWQTDGMTHIVSAFATENRLVLAQLGFNDKENEITAIPKLLAMIDLKDATVTSDAIWCQRELARQITRAKGYFVLQVKDNQPTLHAKVKTILDEAILERRILVPNLVPRP